MTGPAIDQQQRPGFNKHQKVSEVSNTNSRVSQPNTTRTTPDSGLGTDDKQERVPPGFPAKVSYAPHKMRPTPPQQGSVFYAQSNQPHYGMREPSFDNKGPDSANNSYYGPNYDSNTSTHANQRFYPPYNDTGPIYEEQNGNNYLVQQNVHDGYDRTNYPQSMSVPLIGTSYDGADQNSYRPPPPQPPQTYNTSQAYPPMHPPYQQNGPHFRLAPPTPSQHIIQQPLNSLALQHQSSTPTVYNHPPQTISGSYPQPSMVPQYFVQMPIATICRSSDGLAISTSDKERQNVKQRRNGRYGVSSTEKGQDTSAEGQFDTNSGQQNSQELSTMHPQAFPTNSPRNVLPIPYQAPNYANEIPQQPHPAYNQPVQFQVHGMVHPNTQYAGSFNTPMHAQFGAYPHNMPQPLFGSMNTMHQPYHRAIGYNTYNSLPRRGRGRGGFHRGDIRGQNPELKGGPINFGNNNQNNSVDDEINIISDDIEKTLDVKSRNSSPTKQMLKLNEKTKDVVEKQELSLKCETSSNNSEKLTECNLEEQSVNDTGKKLCCFKCKTDNQPKEVYESHNIRYPNDDAWCPVLRKEVCPLCGATGAKAHSKLLCPERKKQMSSDKSENKVTGDDYFENTSPYQRNTERDTMHYYENRPRGNWRGASVGTRNGFSNVRGNNGYSSLRRGKSRHRGSYEAIKNDA